MESDEVINVIKSLDAQFYKGFDPFFHFVLCEMINTGDFRNYRVQVDGVEKHNEIIIEKIEAAKNNIADYRKTTVRILRYFSSETLILLLLSGIPNGLFYDISKRIRGKKLNRVFDELSEKKVPGDFELNNDKQSFTFLEWLSYLVFGSIDQVGTIKEYNIDRMIQEEAMLLKERGAINSFKHGRPIQQGKSLKMEIINKTTGNTTKNIELKGLNWFDWKAPNTEGGITFTFNTEEVKNSENDQIRIFQIAQLMEVIRLVRIARHEESEMDINISIPMVTKLDLVPLRQNITININPVE